MGCDIHGWVEIRTHNWYAMVNIEGCTGRSYDTYGCLFGVRNSANFEPVAKRRGLPDDLSIKARRDYQSAESDHHSMSYLTYEEIQDIDWSESAQDSDGRVAVVDEDGETQIKAGYIAGVHDGLSEEQLARAQNGDRIPLTDTDGEARYATHKTLTRDEAVSGAWQWLLGDQMDLLADQYGAENVRLVVWFDN